MSVPNEPKSRREHSETLPPARDPEVAIREEYEIALKRGTAEALDLFVRRHPEHPLAAKAASASARLRAKGAP